MFPGTKTGVLRTAQNGLDQDSNLQQTKQRSRCKTDLLVDASEKCEFILYSIILFLPYFNLSIYTDEHIPVIQNKKRFVHCFNKSKENLHL